MATIEFRRETVGHFISDNFLRVPIYQRSFAWEKVNVQELFDDIKNSFPDDYFIGTVVVTNKGGYYEIVDGQQRLATICLFFTMVRDLLKDKNHKKWEYIEKEYLFQEALRDEMQQKLKLNATDNDFFLQRILRNNPNILPSKESHEKIWESYQEIQSFIESEVKSKDLNGLFDLVEFITEKLTIIVVIVSDEANAFTIFETLNDRGLKLSQTDLIKNYLFNKAGDRLNEAQDKWIKFTGAIESSVDEDEILQYIRYFWSSKNGLVREKELFKEIKSKMIDKNLSITFLSNLERGVEKYLALLNPNHPLWKDYPHDCANSIYELKELELVQPRPLCFAILEMFANKSDISKALRLIVSWSVRNLITGVTSAGILEKEFSNQAKLINDGKIKTFSDLKKSINHLIPTDEQFKSSFEIATVSKAKIARYYLRKIEESFRPTEEMATSQIVERVSLEHILPENPTNIVGDWSTFNEDTHRTYYRRLGNLTLIDTKMNSEIKDGSFVSKKEIYKLSDVAITKSLCNYIKWDIEEIEKRQKEFAEKALIIWSI